MYFSGFSHTIHSHVGDRFSTETRGQPRFFSLATMVGCWHAPSFDKRSNASNWLLFPVSTVPPRLPPPLPPLILTISMRICSTQKRSHRLTTGRKNDLYEIPIPPSTPCAVCCYCCLFCIALLLFVYHALRAIYNPVFVNLAAGRWYIP